MPHQFENPKATQLDEEIVTEESAKKAIERVAEEAAAKSAKTTHKNDKDQKPFSI